MISSFLSYHFLFCYRLSPALTMLVVWFVSNDKLATLLFSNVAARVGEIWEKQSERRHMSEWIVTDKKLTVVRFYSPEIFFTVTRHWTKHYKSSEPCFGTNIKLASFIFWHIQTELETSITLEPHWLLHHRRSIVEWWYDFYLTIQRNQFWSSSGLICVDCHQRHWLSMGQVMSRQKTDRNVNLLLLIDAIIMEMESATFLTQQPPTRLCHLLNFYRHFCQLQLLFAYRHPVIRLTISLTLLISYLFVSVMFAIESVQLNAP